MFGIKGRLKVTLLVGVFLAVGLGMYAGFQVQDADADGTHVKVTGKIRYFTQDSTVWTFYAYANWTCPDGNSVTVEEKWIISTRYKQVRVYYYHENGSYHWKNVLTTPQSRTTTRTNSYRYRCSVDGYSCPGLNGG